MIICTSANLLQIPQVKVLANSIKRYIPDAIFILCLIEDRIPEKVKRIPGIARIVSVQDLPIKGFQRFMFKLTAPLSQNAIKSQLLQYAMETEPLQENFLYLDCNTVLFGPIPEIMKGLRKHPIVLVPHLITPTYTNSYERELFLLNDGAFNGSLVAVKRHQEAMDFLDWWSDKLNNDKRDPFGSNLFNQKWLDLVPVFYNAYILHHPGYMLAYWNFHESSRQIISYKDKSIQLINGPLRIMTFANENQSFNHYLAFLSETQSRRIIRIKREYLNAIDKNRIYGFNLDMPWSFGYYSSGEQITQEARDAYRSLKLIDTPDNPFEWSNQRILKLLKGVKAV